MNGGRHAMREVIWITSMPRSGSTWVSQMLASHPDIRLKINPLFSYAFKNALDLNNNASDYQDFFNSVYHCKNELLDQEYLRKKKLVQHFKVKREAPGVLCIKSTRFHNLTEYMLKTCKNVKFMALVRHPCGAIHSWLTNPMEFPSSASPKKEWRSGSVRKTGVGEYWGFDDWLEVTSMHLRLAKKWPERFFIVKYEDFVLSAEKTAVAMFNKFGVPFHEQTSDFIDLSQSTVNNHKRAVFKHPSTAFRWKKEMEPNIKRQILDEISNNEVSMELGYK
jgi:hypothetical protein